MTSLAVHGQALALALAVNAAPVLVWGEPGIGKTKTAETIASANKWGFQSVMLAQMDPTDVNGTLWPHTNEAGRLVAERIPPTWARAVAGTDAVLLFDEFSTADPGVQNVAAQILWERRVGELALGSGVRIIAAANPADQIAGAWDLNAQVSDRLIQLTRPTDVGGFLDDRDGFIFGYQAPEIPVLPEGWEKGLQSARAQIHTFLQRNRTAAHAFPVDAAGRSKPWPSFRSWREIAAPLIAAADAVGADDAVLAELLGGVVGPAIGHPFVLWQRELDLPDPARILADPGSVPVPDRDDRVYVAVVSLLAAVQHEGQDGQAVASSTYKTAWTNATIWLGMVAVDYADTAVMAGRKLIDEANKPPRGVPDRKLLEALAPIATLVAQAKR